MAPATGFEFGDKVPRRVPA